MALAWLAPCAFPKRMRLPLLVIGCLDVQSALAAILREADEIIVKPLRSGYDAFNLTTSPNEF